MSQEWIEQLGKRNRTSKTRRLYEDGQPTNTFSCDAQAGVPAHYEDELANWQDIITELVPSVANITGFGNPAYETTENEFEMYVLDELNSGVPVVRYVSKGTEYYIQFAMHDLIWTNDLDQIELVSSPALTATTAYAQRATWWNVYGPGTRLDYRISPGRMAKLLELSSSPAAPPQFIIDGGNPRLQIGEIMEFHGDLSVWIDGAEWNRRDRVVTVNEIEFRDPAGEVQFVIGLPLGWSQDEDDELATILGELEVQRQGPNLFLRIRFPWSWLEGAIYPVVLDATVDKQTAAQGDDGKRWGASSFNVTYQRSVVGQKDANVTHFFARWLGVTLDGTITASYIECYCDEVSGTPLASIYGVDEDNPAAPTTYAEFDADALTTAEVPWDGAATLNSWEQSPSLNSIFQELVDSYTIDNEAVMAQVKDDGSADGNYNRYRMYDYTGNAHGPKLHIEYTVGAASEPAVWIGRTRMTARNTLLRMFKQLEVERIWDGCIQLFSRAWRFLPSKTYSRSLRGRTA